MWPPSSSGSLPVTLISIEMDEGVVVFLSLHQAHSSICLPSSPLQLLFVSLSLIDMQE